MSALKEVFARGHEEVVIYQDRSVGLFAIFAIHDTTLGPSLGGVRMKPYESVEAAFYDVIGLSEAMSYKSSLAGLNLGGGKSVIIRDPSLTEGRAALFESFARKLSELRGKYIAAEDMGTTVADMSIILKSCEHVAGKAVEQGGGGDPSPYTARGVFEGMKACLERTDGAPQIGQSHVVVQGTGHVGEFLCSLLAEAGARLTISDIVPDRAKEVAKKYGAEVVQGDEVFTTKCDIFAPCAVGGIITPESASRLQCRIVAGAANTQLSNSEAERVLARRGITYAPDFAINAGGVMMCADEFEEGGFNEGRLMKRVMGIYNTVATILDESKRSGALPGDTALRLAKERIGRAKAARNG